MLFSCRFPGLREVASYFLKFPSFGSGFFLLGMFLDSFFFGWVGDGFRVFCPAYPPLSVGAGLGNPATHLWHRTRFRSCELGLGSSSRVPCYFSFRPTDPPPARELGAIWITLTTPAGEQDRLVSCVNTFAFPSALSRPTHVAGDMAMAFVDDLFLPL